MQSSPEPETPWGSTSCHKSNSNGYHSQHADTLKESHQVTFSLLVHSTYENMNEPHASTWVTSPRCEYSKTKTKRPGMGERLMLGTEGLSMLNVHSQRGGHWSVRQKTLVNITGSITWTSWKHDSDQSLPTEMHLYQVVQGRNLSTVAEAGLWWRRTRK